MSVKIYFFFPILILQVLDQYNLAVEADLTRNMQSYLQSFEQNPNVKPSEMSPTVWNLFLKRDVWMDKVIETKAKEIYVNAVKDGVKEAFMDERRRNASPGPGKKPWQH